MRGIFRGVLGLCASVLLLGVMLALPAHATGGNHPNQDLECDEITVDYHRGLVNGDHINIEIQNSDGSKYQVNAYVDRNIAGGYDTLGLRFSNGTTRPLEQEEVASGVIEWKYVGLVRARPYTVTFVQTNSTDTWPNLECDTPSTTPDIEVTPAAPTSVDACGMIDDAYTIPSSEGVGYQINDGLIAPGVYPGFGSVTITAYALPGYVLTGTSSWTFVFTDEACPPEIIINPSASVEVNCEGAGEAIFDNSLSTAEVGFELVVNGQATLYPVSAGGVVSQDFSGATPGSLVVVQDGEANELDSAIVPEGCDEPEPPTPPVTPGPTPEPPVSIPPATPVGSKQPPSRISVAPNAGMASSEVPAEMDASASAWPTAGALAALLLGVSAIGCKMRKRRHS